MLDPVTRTTATCILAHKSADGLSIYQVLQLLQLAITLTDLYGYSNSNAAGQLLSWLITTRAGDAWRLNIPASYSRRVLVFYNNSEMPVSSTPRIAAATGEDWASILSGKPIPRLLVLSFSFTCSTRHTRQNSSRSSCPPTSRLLDGAVGIAENPHFPPFEA